MKSEEWLLPYTMNDEMREKLLIKLRRITGITLVYDIEFVRYLNPDIDGKEHIVISSDNLDLKTIEDIYHIVLPEFDDKSVRVQRYCKFRKVNSLKRAETLFTIASYLQANGITDKIEIINRILLYIS